MLNDREMNLNKKFERLLFYTYRIFEFTEKSIDTFSNTLKWNNSDNYGLLTLTFLIKQHQHIKSVIALVNAECYLDASAISRMMLEGMTLLKWVRIRKDERASLWKAFIIVSDWKLLLEKKTKNEFFDDVDENRIRQLMREYCSPFFTKKARENGIDSVEQLFQETWLIENGQKLSLKKIFEEICEEDIFKNLYQESSQWIHWTPSGILKFVTPSKEKLRIDFQSIRDAELACIIAIFSMAKTILIFSEHFKLSYESEVEKLYLEIIEEFDLKINFI
jgi:hypothetical protein